MGLKSMGEENDSIRKNEEYSADRVRHLQHKLDEQTTRRQELE